MGISISDGFDPGDDEKVVSILKKWKGGVLSDNLFATISGMSPQVSVITVIFRSTKNGKEILLLKRPGDDPTWPEMLNLPGKMLRKSDFRRNDDSPINGPIERIEKDEIKTKFLVEPKFIGLAFQDTKRGPIVVLVHIANAEGLSENSDWIWRDIGKLQESKDMIPTEMDVIEVAARFI